MTAQRVAKKYTRTAYVFGLRGKGECERLFARVEELLDAVEIPRSLAKAGVEQDELGRALPNLARTAFMDPSVRTNPRMPLVSELVDLLRAGYAGRS